MWEAPVRRGDRFQMRPGRGGRPQTPAQAGTGAPRPRPANDTALPSVRARGSLSLNAALPSRHATIRARAGWRPPPRPLWAGPLTSPARCCCTRRWPAEWMTCTRTSLEPTASFRWDGEGRERSRHAVAVPRAVAGPSHAGPRHPPPQAKLHKLRQDSNVRETAWHRRREDLPEAFVWAAPPADAAPASPAAGRLRKVRRGAGAGAGACRQAAGAPPAGRAAACAAAARVER
jgi:hypothetical protein